MASTIKLKNGSGAPLAGDLVQGEPALDLTNKRLYTEDSGGNVIEVGVNPSSLTIGGTALTATAAELNTLDGITATVTELNYTDGVTSNIQTQLDSMVEKAGDSMTGNLSFGDNNKVVLGAGSDLQIYHDGSNSRIIDSGTGGLYLQGSSFVSLTNSAATETYLYAAENGAVQLKYDNSTKLATTSSGVDVTGTVTADGLVVDGTGNALISNGQLQVSAGAGAQYTTRLSTAYFGTTVRSYIDSFAGTAYDGALYFRTNNNAGSMTNRMLIQDSGDISFYEDTGTTAKFFWDASAESLCINNTNSSARLVVGGTRNDATIELLQLESVSDWSSGDALGSLVFRSADPSGAGSGIKGSIHYKTTGGTGSDTYMTFNVAGTAAGTNDIERMRIDSSGNLLLGGTSKISATPLDNGVYLQSQTDGDVLGYNLYSNEGTNNRRAAFFLDDTNGVYGFDVSASTGIPPFVIRAVGTERMRIDSSGNLLVGKTSADHTTAGISLYGAGIGSFVRDGAVTSIFNRLTSDGTIAEFRKDGVPVGGVGVQGGNLYIENGDTGLLLNDLTSEIRPAGSGGVPNDAVVTLGSTSKRFKDLYLSGGVYLGGTGADNLLDDYEEGTFVAVVTGTTTAGTATYTNQAGKYVKIGDLVFVQVYVTFSGHTGSGNMEISLPFTAYTQTGLSVGDVSIAKPADTYLGARTQFNSPIIRVNTGSTTGTTAAATGLALPASGTINISGTYRVS